MKAIKIIIGVFVGIIIFLGLFFNFKKLNDAEEIPKLSGFTMMEIGVDGMSTKAKMGDFVVLQEVETYEVDDVVVYKNGLFIDTGKVTGVTDQNVTVVKDNGMGATTINSNIIVGKVVLNISGSGKVWNFLINPIVTGLLIVAALGYTVQKLVSQ